MAEEEEAGAATAAMGQAVAVEVMVAVEGVEAVVDMAAAAGKADAAEVMVAAEGMVIVEVVVEMAEAVGETVDGVSRRLSEYSPCRAYSDSLLRRLLLRQSSERPCGSREWNVPCLERLFLEPPAGLHAGSPSRRQHTHGRVQQLRIPMCTGWCFWPVTLILGFRSSHRTVYIENYLLITQKCLPALLLKDYIEGSRLAS